MAMEGGEHCSNGVHCTANPKAVAKDNLGLHTP